MKTKNQINSEVERLRRVREYLGYTIDSLIEKIQKIESLSDCKEIEPSTKPITSDEYLELESRIYAFIDDQSEQIDFINHVGASTKINTLGNTGVNINGR